jgi:hypothetical protein
MKTTILFYRSGHEVPALEWLDSLSRAATEKLMVTIELLAERGNQLHRPYSDYLEQGIYELRVRQSTVNYRLLYFFHGQALVILSHGFTKEDKVPTHEIRRAVQSKQRVVEQEAEDHVAEVEL